MLKNSASLTSSLTTALLDGHFEHPAEYAVVTTILPETG
jgi:hypothetical protein